jgi:hypothetical protein
MYGILERYDQDTLTKYLDLLQLQGDKVKNKAGWILSAIGQKYNLTKVENWYREKEEEKIRQEEENRVKLANKKLQEEEKRIAKENSQLVAKWKNKYGQEKEDWLRLEVIKELQIKNPIVYSCLLKQARSKELSFHEFSKTNPFVNGALYAKILELAKKEFPEETKNPTS